VRRRRGSHRSRAKSGLFLKIKVLSALHCKDAFSGATARTRDCGRQRRPTTGSVAYPPLVTQKKASVHQRSVCSGSAQAAPIVRHPPGPPPSTIGQNPRVWIVPPGTQADAAEGTTSLATDRGDAPMYQSCVGTSWISVLAIGIPIMQAAVSPSKFPY